MKSLRGKKQETMNCYAGLAKRLIKSCFPQVIPVPQLEPLDAKNIVKQDMTDISTNKPISDEEAWAVAIAWAEAKAKEREAKEESQTDTDESYDSDDSEFGVPTYPVKKSGLFANEDEDTVEQLVRSIIAQWVTTSKKWYAASTIQAVVRGRLVRSGAYKFFDFTDYYNAYYMRKAAEARQCWWVTTYTLSRTATAMATLWNVEKRAATIIQAAERGRVVRMVVVIVAEATKVLRLSKFVAVDWEGIAVARAVLAMGVAGLMNTRAVDLVKAVVECDAATIIQAAARGRAVRLAAWDDGFAALDAALLMRLRKERRRATKETRRAWKAAFDPTTWYRV
jgi:hypothetical protein